MPSSPPPNRLCQLTTAKSSQDNLTYPICHGDSLLWTAGERDGQAGSLFRLYAVLIIWLSTMNMNGCYPIVASMRNNPLCMNCQLPRKSDCLLLLLNGCLAKMDGSEELALFSSFLENSDIKRSFRNGVGSGIKKISFRRAKS
ncbi:neuropeptide S [Protobothrops mucrosquamatus]|uniref:neuropeptide S n=1 Tax=Protobothrops mucrosquamatus TaxID=103944 RepID=UPI00077573B4|nr:neuropeptide S [Protobothrops mucrosquamatus]